MSVAHPDWRDDAACRGSTRLFVMPLKYIGHPGSPIGTQAQKRINRAKAICAGCPVAAACLDDYLAHPDQVMIAGGLTPAERSLLRSEMAS